MSKGTKNLHPLKMKLRILASRLELGFATKEEIRSIAEMLRRVGDGELMDSILGVNRPPHRPQTHKLEQIVWDVMAYRFPFDGRQTALTKIKAITEVASIYKVEEQTIHDYYKSERGKKIRTTFKSNMSYSE